MKVLIIDEWLPWPLESGKKIRTYNLIKCLAKHHEIIYMAYVDTIKDMDKIDAMENEGIRVFPVDDSRTPKWGARFYLEVALNFFSSEPFSSQYHIKNKFIEGLVRVLEEEKPDLVHCEWTNLAPFLKFVKDIPRVISAHNIESDIWRRFGKHGSNVFKRIIGNSQARKIERLERKWYPAVEMCIAVSQADKEVIQSYGARVEVVDNGVDIGYYSCAEGEIDPYSLIFTASFDTFSNQDGAVYFIKEIYPLIKQKSPHIKLWLVGKEPPYYMKSIAQQDESIHVTGTVSDVRPYITKACVCIVPLRIGGGSRLKILEAFAMKKAVVSTSVGAEGLAITHGKNIMIADTPLAFAENVMKCLLNADLRSKLSEQGYSLVTNKYDWKALANKQHIVWSTLR